MKTKIITWFFWLCLHTFAHSATLTTNGSASDVQAKLNSASNGDTITIPAGTFSWSSGVTINKAVTISGSGYTPSTKSGGGNNAGPPTLSTIINFSGGNSTDCFNFSLPTTGGYVRLTGIKIAGATSTRNSHVESSGSPNSDSLRIDNCIFDGGSAQVVLCNLYGNARILIDHCLWTGGTSSELVHDMGLNAGNTAGWQDDVSPGSDRMVYMEDNIFQVNNYNQAGIYQYSTSAFQCYYGSRTVARFNLMRYCKGDCHGNVDPNARWIEFYSNTWSCPPNQKGSGYVFDLRGGSGVLYDNKVDPGCSPTYAPLIRLYTDLSSSNNSNPHINGPGPVYGPGAGIFSSSNTSQGPDSSPVYLWNNDSQISIGTNVGVGNWSPSPIVAGKNFFVSTTKPASMKISQTKSQIGGATYSYTPYQYPHPLIARTQGGGGPGPTPTPTATPSPTPTPQPTPTPSPTPNPSPTPPASTKFKVGDNVSVVSVGNVRDSAGGNLVGTQPIGAQGQVTDGPDWAEVPGGSGVYWWKVNFTSGVDGWVGEDSLEKVSGGPTPTPSPSPTPGPSPSPSASASPSPTYEKWINEQNAWIRAHPPFPD